MFEIVRYSAQRSTEWNVFVERSKNGTFLFDRRYMDYHAMRYADFSLMFYVDGRLKALFPAEIKGGTLCTHGGLTYGGLVTDFTMTAALAVELFQRLNSYLHREGVEKVVYKAIPWIYHSLPAEEDLYALSRVCKARLVARDISSVIDLRCPLKWYRDRRYGVKKASRNGVEIGESDDYEAFWHVLEENLMGKYGVKPVHSLQEIELLKKRFPANIRLYTAVKDGTVLGGTVLYLTPQTVHAQYISANAEGKRLRVLDAVFDRVLCKDLASFRYFDFGKSTEDLGTVLNEKLIYQKEGFGGRGVCYDWYEWNP